MENRKELSEKSKKLIAKQFKSDILNISTGYYKKEKIFPITSKPNESKPKVNKFIPKFKEIKPSEMRINNLLSDQQKHNKVMMQNLKLVQNKKNPELDSMRKRTKIIKDNCYDERGNFSARKRHLLEFYGIENVNYKPSKESNMRNIRDSRNKLNRSLPFQRIPKLFDSEAISINSNENKSNFFNDKDNLNNNLHNYEKENINLIEDYFNNIKIVKNYNFKKFSRNKNSDLSNNLSSASKEDFENSINSIKNKEKMFHRIKTDINFTDINSNKNEQNKEKVKKTSIHKNFYYPKELNKVFYTHTNNPVRSNRLNKNERDNEEKEYFSIEIRNSDSIPNGVLASPKKVKEIFYKNGLHIYDFNEDGMNILSTKKKMEMKL